MFDQLMTKGRDILDTTELGTERENLERKITNTNDRWKTAVEKTNTQECNLEEIRPLAKAYDSVRNRFVVWLETTEEEVEPLNKVTRAPEEIAKQLELVTRTLQVVDERALDVKEISENASETLKLAQADKYVVEGEVEDINKRWRILVDMLNTKEQWLVRLKDAAEVLEFAQKNCEKPFEEVKKFIKECKPSGINRDEAEKKREKSKEKLAMLEIAEGTVNKVSLL